MAIKFNQKGTIVLIVFLIMGVLLFLGSYFLSFSLTESRISKSQDLAVRTYYLAEAGINEAIWKLKNDIIWANQFITNPNWSANFSNDFGSGSYIVSIQNFEQGRGEIISTATIDLGGGKASQRVVKVVVFKALGSPVGNSALFTDGPSGNMNVGLSNIIVNNGNIFCGNNLNVFLSNFSIVDNEETEDLEGQLLIHNNLLQSYSTITSETICAHNECSENCDTCPAPASDLPTVDFDSSGPNSFKSRAQLAEDLGQCQIFCNGRLCSNKCVFTSWEFLNLLFWNSSISINNEITFVDGDVNILNKNLVINGVLVAKKNINIFYSSITVNRPSEQSPSGLISGKKMSVSLVIIEGSGVIYSSDQMNILSSSGNITGGFLARKFSALSLPSLIINLNNDIILYGLGYIVDGSPVSPNPSFSPVITIDHWEESY